MALSAQPRTASGAGRALALVTESPSVVCRCVAAPQSHLLGRSRRQALVLHENSGSQRESGSPLQAWGLSPVSLILKCPCHHRG